MAAAGAYGGLGHILGVRRGGLQKNPACLRRPLFDSEPIIDMSTVMMNDNPNTAKLRQQYPDCAVKGCGLGAYGYSRYCVKHREQFYSTRSPTGRILRTGRDLRPYRELATAYYAQHREHPAIVAAVGWLGELLVKAQGTAKGPLNKELRRLFRDGATGERMFLRIAAVAGYAFYNSRTWSDDAVHTTNLGHSALSTTRMPMKRSASGAMHPTRFAGSTAFALGQSIREVLGVLLGQFWQAIDRSVHALDREREAVNSKLRESPL